MAAMIERWLETSRLNPTGLLRMRHPQIPGPLAARLDALLEEPEPSGEVDYRSAVPRWVFLHHLVQRGFVLHGSNRLDVREFRTRATFDAHGEPIEGVFASDDAIWPLYF